MNDGQFEDLIRRLEPETQSDPKRYQRKVLLLATLGNLYIAAMLFLVLAILAALVASIMTLKAFAVKLIIALGVFLWMVVKALWVKVEPPDGIEIKPAQAPELFALVDELRRRLGAPRFHHILVTSDFNAGVVQSPRLGIFGWPRNYLLTGLPLMKTLSVDQFKAVLAHEFGHLAKGHGRVSNWIYRQRLRWARLLSVLEASDNAGSLLFKPFFNWFAPYFSAYSFPMARSNEYEADATAAKLTSPRTAAEALTGVNVVGSYLAEKYWPQVHKQAEEHPQPSFAPYVGIAQGIAKEIDTPSAETWLRLALARKTDLADTHPALSDRLKAIGESARLALPDLGQTADRLLGSALDAITEGFDQRWRSAIAPSWEERYRQVQDDRRRLAELNARFTAGEELSPQEAYNRARLTESIGNDPEDGIAQLQALRQRLPADAVVCLALGARLLQRNDSKGIALLEEGTRLDENATAAACELLRDFHMRNGNAEEAKTWRARMVERLKLQEAAANERSRVLLKDRFEPHALDHEALAELREKLRKLPGLRKAYLAKKRVQHLPHLACYVFGYTSSQWYQLESKERAREVLRRIQESVQFPGETLILSVEGDNCRFGRKFRRMRGARIL